MANFSSSPGLQHDPKGGEVTLLDASKPREERHYKEIYPDLDESLQLHVLVLPDEEQNTSQEDEASNDADSSKRMNAENVPLKVPNYRMVNDRNDEMENIRFSKQITEYGFQEPSRPSQRHVSEAYTRPHSFRKEEKSFQGILDRRKKQVAYDMDEQDYLYLQHRNNQSKNTIKISPEIFEITITILENEWEELELRMNTIGKSDDDSGKLLTLDEGSSCDKYGNDDGIEQGSFDEQKCAVCNDSDCDNSNAIVFCDGCNIAVHQECYGIAFIPEGQWLCRKCMINRNRKVDCVFCPSNTGAFKQLDNSLWSHVVCAIWINELYFANPIYMEPIEGLDLIPRNRWKLSCYICRQKTGACIQCTNRNCFQAYHVTCAKRAGLYMLMAKGTQGAIQNKNTLSSFCDRHCPPGWNSKIVVDGIEKTRLYFRDVKILNDQNARLTQSQKTANKLNSLKWKTENKTPIAPKAFSDKLFRTLIELNIEKEVSVNPHSMSSMLRDLNSVPNRTREAVWAEIRDISNEMCRYWCLKRSIRNGAPLIRKNDNLNASSSILYGNNQADEILSKIDFANVLLQDLDSIAALSHATVRRQSLLDSIAHLDFHVLDAVYFPVKTLIGSVLDSVTAKFDKHGVLAAFRPRSPYALSMRDVRERNDACGYPNVASFQDDVEKCYSVVMSEQKPIHNAHKVFKRWMREFRLRLPDVLRSEERISQDLHKGRLRVPFVSASEGHVKFKPHDPPALLASAGLSEVDDTVDPVQDPLFHRFLHDTGVEWSSADKNSTANTSAKR